MIRRLSRGAVVVAVVVGMAATTEVQGQDHGPRVELTIGVATDPDALGNTGVLEEGGYLGLGQVGRGAILQAGFSSAGIWRGLRPAVRMSWRPARSLGAWWTPCAPGAACPSILAEPDTRVSRADIVGGVEGRLPVALGPVVSALFVAAGVQRFTVSWREWGEPGGIHLPDGAETAHEAVFAGGLTLAVGAGRWTVLGRLDASVSRFGPGRVTGSSGAEVDLGRRRISAFAFSLGVRSRVGTAG